MSLPNGFVSGGRGNGAQTCLSPCCLYLSRDNADGVEMCEFSPHGTRSRAKKLDGELVRLVRSGRGGQDG